MSSQKKDQITLFTLFRLDKYFVFFYLVCNKPIILIECKIDQTFNDQIAMIALLGKFNCMVCEWYVMCVPILTDQSQ